MSSGRSVWIGLIILLISVSLSACGPPAEDQTATELPSTPTVTIPPTSTPVQTISPSAEDYFNEGNEFFNDNDLNSALEAFSNAIEMRSDYAEAYLERGRVYAIQGTYYFAIEDLTTAIELDPENTVAHFLRAMVCDYTAQYGLAVSDYDFVIEHDPEFAEAYVWRARGLAFIGEFDKAELDIQRALELGLDANQEQLAQQILAGLPGLRAMMVGNVNLDGSWSGSTGQDQIFEFTVDNNAITTYRLGYDIPGCEYNMLDSSGGPPRTTVQGNRFTIEDDSITISGTFIAETMAVGSIELRVLFCEGGLVTSWGTQRVR